MVLLKLETWGPDTCQCQVHLMYDRDLPGDVRTHTFRTKIEAQALADIIRDRLGINRIVISDNIICPVHIALGETVAMYNVLVNENTRKNRTFSLAIIAREDLTLDNFTWSFDDSRVLEITFVDITVLQAEKDSLQASADLQFGPGLVRIL